MNDTESRAREHFAQHEHNELYTATALGRHYHDATGAIEKLMAEFAEQEVRAFYSRLVELSDEKDETVCVYAAQQDFRETFGSDL